jgi:LPS export ABC transporter protein LptC
MILALLLLAGGGAIFYASFKLMNHPEYLNGKNPENKPENAIGQAITLTETKNGNRKWVMKIQDLHYAKATHMGLMKGVEGLVYDDKNEVMFTFTAPEGVYDKVNSMVSLDKGAKIISPKTQASITAPKMKWSSSSDIVEATGGVKMDKQQFGVSQADQAYFAMDFSRIEFRGHLHSSIGGTTPSNVVSKP